jgi:hypothetical protein
MKFDKPIILTPYDDDWQRAQDYTDKLMEYASVYTLKDSENNEDEASINMEVWRTGDHQQMFPTTIYEGNSLSVDDIARFGLYIPLELAHFYKDKQFTYENFITTDSIYHKRQSIFKIDDEIFFENIKTENINTDDGKVKNGLFVPDHCFSDSETCAIVLTSHFYDTKFFIHHVEKLKLKMKVYFLGGNLKQTMRNLVKVLKQSRKLFLVLHWTPSEIIDGSDKFVEVLMPKCEVYRDIHSSCKYDVNSVSIFFNEIVEKNNNELAHIMQNIKFKTVKDLIELYEERFPAIQNILNMNKIPNNFKDTDEDMRDVEDIYNEIACTWLRLNSKIYDANSEKKWYSFMDDYEIVIGGM